MVSSTYPTFLEGQKGSEGLGHHVVKTWQALWEEAGREFQCRSSLAGRTGCLLLGVPKRATALDSQLS